MDMQDVTRQKNELINMGVLEENIYFEYESRYKRRQSSVEKIIRCCYWRRFYL